MPRQGRAAAEMMVGCDCELLDVARVVPGDGIVALEEDDDFDDYIDAAADGGVGNREPSVRIID
jgi:hypothetical protein